jgi:hypothetical protein
VYSVDILARDVPNLPPCAVMHGDSGAALKDVRLEAQDVTFAKRVRDQAPIAVRVADTPDDEERKRERAHAAPRAIVAATMAVSTIAVATAAIAISVSIGRGSGSGSGVATAPWHLVLRLIRVVAATPVAVVAAAGLSHSRRVVVTVPRRHRSVALALSWVHGAQLEFYRPDWLT